MMELSRENLEALPMATIGVLKGVLEVYVLPTVETYKPRSLEETVETATLGLAIGTTVLAGYCIYKSLTDESA